MIRSSVVLVVWVLAARAGVTGSKHDLSGGGTYFNGQVCVYCHTPHQALREGGTAVQPLWNRRLPSESFTMYSSPTLHGSVDAQPAGSTRLCLSCHDGFTAMPYADLEIDWNNPRRSDRACSLCHSGGVTISNVLVAPNGNPGSSIPGHGLNNPSGAILGSDLSNDHPVSIVYTDVSAALAGGAMASPGSAASGLGGTIRHDLLRNDRVECVSCHEPHSTTFGWFLRISNDGGQLCATCHTW